MVSSSRHLLVKEFVKLKKWSNGGSEADGNKYYGKLTDKLEVDYLGSYKVVVYHCD